VNDCFKPVSRYWDRIYRPEQLITALPEVMRVLTSPSDCGAATLALPQDVQAEAYDYPEELFRKRVWLIRRGAAGPGFGGTGECEAIRKAASKPLIVAGGGVLMSGATQALAEICCRQTGIPVAETQAGKGSLEPGTTRSAVGAIGATGTLGRQPAGACGGSS
jgi:3D-(3,5/4)-trihydroxycyclohexane-1,2-dione acylhydrolase (decyclizing)